MKRNEFDLLVLEKNKRIFDWVILLGAVIAFISSYVLYINDISHLFSIADIVVGSILLILYFLRNNIQTSLKINVVIVVTMILGMLILLDRGFVGSGFYLFIIINVIAAIFLSKKKSFMIAGITLVFVIGLMIMMTNGLFLYSGYDDHLNNMGEWLIHFGTYILSLLVIHLTINGMKSHLLENIERLEESVERIYKLAYFDSLTQLPNRVKFLESLMQKSKESPMNGHILLIEVKGLKLLNSINSNEFGDDVLIKISEILREKYDTNDGVARVSGGEFAIWINNVEIDRMDDHITSLLKVLDQQLRIKGIEQKIEWYTSYAACRGEDETVERCYQKATLALGYAKSLKYLTITSYNKEMEEKTKYDLLIGDMVSEAIELWEFKVVYHEKMDVTTGKVFGVEALARWESKILGQIPPSIFIPIIEKNNMAVNFGNKMIGMVLDDMTALQKKYGNKIMVSINISPSHFMTKGFKEQIIQEITSRRLDPNQILLEMTEEVMIAGFDIAEGVMTPLKEFGIGISLDDFGTGYSSLSYFAKMDFSELKIDKSFIDQIHETNKIRALIKSIIQLAKSYGVDVVAEGVETKEQLDILVDLGCHLIQGYYFSKPESIDKEVSQ